MAMASINGQRTPFFPRADASVLSSKQACPRIHPQTVGPILDPDNIGKPLEPWNLDLEESCYPPKVEAYAASTIPKQLADVCGRYLRATLAKNERLRLSMLWYYTRDILEEPEFLSGLQEKARLAKESTEWEFAVIGIMDVNFYIRLAALGLPLGILPRGETICSHTISQPPGSVFMLPNMVEDWRFQDSPYVKSGGLLAYAGAPLRLKDASGDWVGLGSICVASSTSQEPLTKTQQHTLAYLADWVVSDLVQCAKSRRQRERHRMSELVAAAQAEIVSADSEEPVLSILRTVYPDTVISLRSSKAGHLKIEGRGPILLSDLEDGLWEDTDYIDDFIATSNNQVLPNNRTVRVIAAQCEGISGPCLLAVASRDFRLVFDDIDVWTSFSGAFVINSEPLFMVILGSAELLAQELKSLNFHESPVTPATVTREVVNAASTGAPNVHLEAIQRSGRDLISLVNSMITLDRWAVIAMADRCYAIHTIDELEAELANEIVKALSGDTRYKASIFFDNNLTPDSSGFRTDLNLLRDSLLPLIVNAIQHTPEGIITVTTSISSESKELIIDIEDTGHGIPPDHHHRIFEPYEKVEEHSTGAGLGLTLASKFATLLHGSVDLISSEIGRGSHFRATFQDVECAFSLSSQPLATRLKNIPSKFYSMASASGSASLCNCFARFLSSHGFTSSDSINDSFIILDYVPDLEQRLTSMSRLPPGQVGICLVPASEGEIPSRKIANNVVYLGGVFTRSSMSSALEEADGRLSVIAASRARETKTDEHLLLPPSKIESTIIDDETKPSPDLDHSMERPTQLPENPAVDFNLDASLPISRPESASPMESRVFIPIFSALVSTPKPTALLVDDNIVNLRILQVYCRKRGLPYLSAGNGMEAVEMFAKYQSLAFTGGQPPIQLIFMDLQMPIRDGIEATRQIRLLEKQQQWGQSTLFIVTGQDSVADRTASDSAGADDYFVKPVSIKLLDHAVKRYFPAFTAI
ncbi:hypothetical protein AK830_g4106 [Neonectria ditissima]|uniref:histidine kinase n=1 Tax=Neonectria ditissima TaxID=78410 RepID=A0A0P7B9P9_9HYPO|nr:hypothetical protein AK830_g4106 [Neonectria ditissima]